MGNHYDSCRRADREREERSRSDFVTQSLEDARKLVDNATEIAKARNLKKAGIEKTTVVVYKTIDGAMFFNEADARKHMQSINIGADI